jgi:isoleucyl-tRNA synthetase
VGRAAALQEEVIAAYRNYQFHVIYQRVHQFCVVDLGGCYLDVLKDRLYTTPAKSAARRSAQTAMFHIIEAMVRWLAPILSFTSEEIWSYLPAETDRGPRAKSVFHTTWHSFPAVPASATEWDALLALRADVARELERLREAGEIGAPLEAEVEVRCAGATYQRLSALGSELRFFLITSSAKVIEQGEGDSYVIDVRATTAPKCVRCWHRRPDVGSHADHPELCDRCVTNITTAGEERHYA